jgi:DNA-binding CsgD family transcriptional regulator
VALLDKALQVSDLATQADDDTRFGLSMEMGLAQYQSGELTSATRTLMKAALLAHRKRWWPRLADALFLFQLVCQQSGYRHVSSVPLHNAVLDHIGPDDAPLRARVLASLAKALRTAGEPDRAAATFRQSIELARAADDDRLLLNCLRKGNWTVGRHPTTVREGLEVAREANELARRLGDTEGVLDSLVDMIFQLCDLGEMDEVERQLVVLRELAEKERQPHFENVLLGFEAAVALQRGEWGNGVRKAQEGLRRLPMQGVVGLQGRFGFQVFWIRKSLGTLGELDEIAERIISNIDDAALWLPGQILLHCEIGQLPQARASLRRLGPVQDLPKDDLSQVALAFLADACVRLNDRKRCALLFELLTPYRGLNLTLPGTLMLGAASGYLARLAGALGRDGEARELYEEAIELNAAMRAKPALADVQVGLASLLLRSRSESDRARAGRLLADARALARGLELQPVLRSIDELSDETGPTRLTGREIDVLRQLAAGSSNKVIARDLDISHSTVATHVRHIFRKLGVSNRTEAAEFARRAGVLDSD